MSGIRGRGAGNEFERSRVDAWGMAGAVMCLPPAAASTAAAVAATVASTSSSTTVLGATVASTTSTSAAAVSAVASAATLTVVAVATTATTSSTTATTSATVAAAEAALVSDGVQPARDLLVSLTKELDEVAHDVAVTTVEERGSHTDVAGTARTADTVNVIVNVGGQIVVDDVGDVGDVESTSGNGSGNQDGGTPRAEGLESHFTLALSAVTVNGSRGEGVAKEEVGKHVGHALGLYEYEGQAVSLRLDNVEKD